MTYPKENKSVVTRVLINEDGFSLRCTYKHWVKVTVKVLSLNLFHFTG